MCILETSMLCSEDRERLQAEVEAKNAEIDRQQQQLQTLIVSSYLRST